MDKETFFMWGLFSLMAIPPWGAIFDSTPLLMMQILGLVGLIVVLIIQIRND